MNRARAALSGRSVVPGFVRDRLQAVLGGRRGSAQLGLVLAAAAVAGGMTLGTGVASHAARSGYDLAWIGDSSRGQAVQVDPVLGRANVRLQVGKPGETLTIQQGNGQLIVVNRKTGRISSIDLGTLLVGGSRAGAKGDAVKVLLAGSRLFVADLPRGTIQAVDPATEATLGTPWSAGRPLVDVAVDGRHDVYALDAAQHLLDLRWDDARHMLAGVTARAVSGAGAGSVLVGHTRGVTLVGDRGTILRVGTDHDTSLNAPDVQGPLHGPTSSPTQLVPVADPGSGQVVIVGQSNAVVDDVRSLGCPVPAAPTVFDNKVYVPCTGSHKVLVLAPGGQQAGSAIPVAGRGDPQLTVSGGHLVIDTPDAGSATVIDTSGHSKSFPTISHGVGVQNPNQTPPAPPAPPSPEPTRHPRDGGQGQGQHRSTPGSSGGDVPSTGHGAPATGGTSSSPNGPASNAPAAGATATATVRPDGSVLVSWTAPDPGGSVSVTRADTGAQVADVASGGSSAMVTVLDPGTTVAFSVQGIDHAGREAWAAATNTVTTMTTPGGVTGVTVSATRNGNDATLAVTWTPASGHGGRVSYTVSADGSNARTTTSAAHASLSVPCASGCNGSVSVTATNSAGTSAAATGTYTVSAVAASTPPANPPANPEPAPTTPTPAPPSSTPPPATTAPPAPAPLPAGGQSQITYTTTRGSRNTGDPAMADLTITNPADWQSFGGTCALTDNGVQTDDPVSCSAPTQDIERDYFATGTHVFTVTATNAGGTVSSASVSVRVIYTTTGCNGAADANFAAGVEALPPCNPIPFVQLQPVGVSTAGGTAGGSVTGARPAADDVVRNRW